MMELVRGRGIAMRRVRRTAKDPSRIDYAAEFLIKRSNWPTIRLQKQQARQRCSLAYGDLQVLLFSMNEQFSPSAGSMNTIEMSWHQHAIPETGAHHLWLQCSGAPSGERAH